MFKIEKYNPFPMELRGDATKGAFCEISENDGTSSKYVIIYPKPYEIHDVKRFLDEGIPLQQIYPEIRLLNRTPKEDTYWLYKLVTYVVDKKFHENQNMFLNNRMDYAEYAFDDFNEVMSFCKKNFHIDIKDFKKDWETNYPQW